VRQGTPVGDQAVVLDGVKAGDTVVLNPPDALRDGDEIKPAAGK
jgi:multidrug efflux pump subunit AcrA (membrane-fusion protein)